MFPGLFGYSRSRHESDSAANRAARATVSVGVASVSVVTWFAGGSVLDRQAPKTPIATTITRLSRRMPRASSENGVESRRSENRRSAASGHNHRHVGLRSSCAAFKPSAMSGSFMSSAR